MCIIIERKPDLTIPYDKFEASVLNNPHGYGLTFGENGKLTCIRDPKKPDPEELYRFLQEELKDQHILLHLRWNTAGKTNLRNAHPFSILERKTHGIDLRMAHNGTIHKYKPGGNSSESDTRSFVREFVRPLFARLVRGYDTAELFSDPFIEKMLSDQIPSSSVLTFLDGEGNSLRVNELGNGGKIEDGVYYSNTYSFNRQHREKGTSVVPFHGSGTKSSTPIQTTGGTGSKFSTKHRVDPEKLLTLSDASIKQVANQPAEAELLIKELLAMAYKSNKDKEVYKRAWNRLKTKMN